MFPHEVFNVPISEIFLKTINYNEVKSRKFKTFINSIILTDYTF